MNAAKPYDEMHAADGAVRAHYQPYSDWLGHTPRELIARKRKEAGAIAAAKVAKTGARAGSRKAARVQEALGQQEPPPKPEPTEAS